MCIGELDESFPNFGFLEDKYFDNFTILAEELVEIIMCYYIPIFVIDTYKEDRAINLRIHAKKLKYFIIIGNKYNLETSISISY